LAWVLPWFLEAWLDDLIGRSNAYAGAVEQLYPTLANARVLGSLRADQRDAIAVFMRDGLLSEIDTQEGLSYSGSGARPYRWIAAHASYGVLFLGVEQLWKRLWAAETRGRAVAVVQYASCLIYDDDNPVFASWAHDRGGGPPCLWEQAGHLYDEPWLEENVRYVRDFLKPARVIDSLRLAVTALAGQQEMPIAEQVLRGAQSRGEVLASRCDELPRLLAHTQSPHNLCEWTV
jgi:hypothetical protein